MTEQAKNKPSYLELVSQKVVIFDGAMGTNLDKLNLTAADFGGEQTRGCNDFLSLSSPKSVEKIHRSFLEVGVDVIETNTFRSNRITLTEYGLADRVQEINHAAAGLARRLADEYTALAHPRYVAGSIGPTGQLPSSGDPALCHLSFDELVSVYHQQAAALLEGGVDLFLVETSQDILEVKAAILGIRQADRHHPLQVQVTLDAGGRMLLGTDIRAVLAILEGMPIDIIGINCSTGPDLMREPISILSRHSSLPVSCSPNAGIPQSHDGQAVYPLTPRDFAHQMTDFVEQYKVNIVGGCCGTTPDHLRLLVEKLGSRSVPDRPKLKNAWLASAMHALPMHQEPAPLIIGERLNTQGSREFKQVILARDWQAALSIARRQVESGAHALDLCTALTEEDSETQTMQQLVQILAPAVDAPLVLDSTDPAVLEAALKHSPGRCLINSINLEGGETKAEKVLELAKRFNAALICLTIDEQGMAKTAERKLAVARRICQLALDKHHLQPVDLVFDPLTFTLASGDVETAASAVETLSAIRLIKKELPGVFTSLGVSNVSFGLSKDARAVLNSIFLYHALQAGLDMAILNAAQVMPYPDIPASQKELAENLLFNRSRDALAAFINCFSDEQKGDRKASTTETKTELTPQEKITAHILNRSSQDLEEDIDLLIKTDSPATKNESALFILNELLLPAMQAVGDKFGKGELILPFVLQSAEVMKKAVDHLEQYLQHGQTLSKGRVVLATVYGDVHDIGKNLVRTILANNGYEVIDLGKQVPAEIIIQTALEQKADAIGLSALLVSTSQQMGVVAEELQRRGLSIPLLIGGAAINAEFAQRIANPAGRQPYAGGIHYCRDAFAALSVLDRISRSAPPTNTNSPMPAEIPLEIHINNEESPSTEGVTQTRIEPAAIPLPPFWGSHLFQPALDEVLPHINKKSLFRLSWGAKNARGEKWEKYSRDFEQRFQRMTADLAASPWLDLSILYGYWPVQSVGNDLLVYAADEHSSSSPNEIAHFHFPRQSGPQGICLADYFASAQSGRMDTAAFQVVTVGQCAIDHINRLYQANDLTGAYYAHGLAVALTEALAETGHARIRRELKLPAKQGRRYSWGYPALPDLSQHAILFSFLPATEKLGLRLTSAFQMSPELSTAAIILHHPQAGYFSMH